ncbi:hypothetical protein ACK2J6_001217 [Vibrio fluvialis]
MTLVYFSCGYRRASHFKDSTYEQVRTIAMGILPAGCIWHIE